MNKISFQSCNVRGLGDYGKSRQMFHYFNVNKFDVILAQETHSYQKCEKLWKSQFGSQILFSHGQSNARGVAVFIKRNIKTKIYKTVRDEHGRFLILDIALDQQRITLANIYGPNSDQPDFFREVFTKINEIGNQEKIVAGNFNTLMSALDKKGGPPTHLNSSRELNLMVESDELVDIWRYLHPNEFHFTWKKVKPRPMMERIDFFLVSKMIAKMVTSAKILPSFKSDHSFLQMVLTCSNYKKGPGYWKLNTMHLNNEILLKELKR